MKKFELTQQEKDNCRLRLYNKFKDEMLDVYEGKMDKTMSQLKLIAQKSFILEIKQLDEVFEDFDPDALTFKLVFWNPEVEHIDFIPPEEKIKVSKKMIIQDLID